MEVGSVKVSQQAVERFKKILKDSGSEDSGIRIFLSGG